MLPPVDHVEHYMLSFDANLPEGVEASISGMPESERLELGSIVSQPETSPVISGLVFAGWYTDPDCTSIYKFGSPIVSDTVLYAKWQVQITFDTDGGEIDTEMLLADVGSVLEDIPVPVKTGFFFSHWIDENGEEFDFNAPLTTSIVLTAVWKNNIADEQGLTYVVNQDGTLSVNSYSGSAEEIVIPDEINGIPVTSINPFVFFMCNTLQNVTVGKNVETIGQAAFYDSSLTNVEFAEGSILESIDAEAFQSCDNLVSINLPDSLKSVGSQAFTGCKALKEIGGIPSDLEIIDNRAFRDTYALAIDIVIPSALKSIGDNAFQGSGIKSLQFEDGSSLEYIGSNAFSKTDNAGGPESSLTGAINIPDSVTDMGTNAFSNTKITSLVIGTGLKSIPDSAFTYCTELESIVIKGAETIGWHSFSNLNSLTSITLNDGLTTIGNNAFASIKSENGADVAILVIPDSVTKIETGAFQRSDGIKNIQLNSTAADLFSGADSVFLSSSGNLYLPNGANEEWGSGWNGQRILFENQSYGE